MCVCSACLLTFSVSLALFLSQVYSDVICALRVGHFFSSNLLALWETGDMHLFLVFIGYLKYYQSTLSISANGSAQRCPESFCGFKGNFSTKTNESRFFFSFALLNFSHFSFSTFVCPQKCQKGLFVTNRSVVTVTKCSFFLCHVSKVSRSSWAAWWPAVVKHYWLLICDQDCSISF